MDFKNISCINCKWFFKSLFRIIPLTEASLSADGSI